MTWSFCLFVFFFGERPQKRRGDLEDAILLSGFNGECDDFEKWLQEKEKQLRADNRGDTVEAAKLKFEVSPVRPHFGTILPGKIPLCSRYTNL